MIALSFAASLRLASSSIPRLLNIFEYFSYGMIFVFLPFADSSLEAET